MTRFISLIALFAVTGCLATPTRLGEGHHAMTLLQGTKRITLISSETSGLRVMEGNNARTLKSGRFGQLDARQLADDKQLIAVLDINSQAVHIFTSDLQSVTRVATIPAGDADVEALCLGILDDIPMLFRADAAGRLNQSALHVQGDEIRVQAVRTLNVGPGTKSCSVHDRSQTLYTADEFAGVWAIPAHQEAEFARTLVVHSPNKPIEAVSVSETGLLGWAGPDEPTLYLRERGGAVPDTEMLALPEAMSPEKLHIDEVNDRIYASVYDDQSETISEVLLRQTTLPQTPVADSSMTMLTADSETAPVVRFGDAADDPAIWFNSQSPDKSLILGTDKKHGLNVYDLTGKLRQTLAVGRVNNVDVRYNWQLSDGSSIDIAAASNRSDNSISLFGISQKTGELRLLGGAPTSLSDVYGLCLYQHDSGIDIFINDTDGRYQRYSLYNQPDGLNARLIDEFRLPSQPEGCVANDESNELFMGEEAAGIWHAQLQHPAITPEKIISVAPPVEADIEGMALFTLDSQDYLIVSSQGNNRYAIYQSQSPFALLGVFAIGADWQRGIDGVSETDGLDATSVALGDDYPDGLLVVQDGRNVMPSENQNFKMVDGAKLKAIIRSLVGE